ncbi:gamma-aminobutyric acid receptor subunit alpha-6-like isoform X2 [Dreissena polymorpha]|uniref:Uncharacterized protein n=2 Tax=Dreissena polymorpha TaxID=45954 RepID=A0A9D4QJL8_DREPO|nr:gamma-aminobutyric acid receptor subunit alpha-6-like isoform X2 [Dreissena polymorpha]KAH3833639.1 hypothetical protein DPMN_106952 [Dreissena polymorpha]
MKDDLSKISGSRVDGLKEDHIHWVLTVPAVWNDSAKQFMRLAAEKAEISADKLSLALEPEAASVYCRHLHVQKDGESSLSTLKAGKTYLVLDAGGGTIDITIHQVCAGGNLKEIHRASGGDWGGTMVDEAFMDFLGMITDKKAVQRFKDESMEDYIELLRDFEIKKRALDNTKEGKVTIKIPVSLSDLAKDVTGMLLQDTLQKHVMENRHEIICEVTGNCNRGTTFSTNTMVGFLFLILSLEKCVLCEWPTYSDNTTEVLDKLLTNYRKEIRPGLGGKPLVIETDLMIRSIGQISESNMDYSFQCYFRQRWTDERLKFMIHNITEVTLNNLFLSLIWKPNTHFLNGQKSHQHNIPTPNLFVRIRNDGRVYMSRRLTVKAACPMRLGPYPMDKPVCPLVLGSYGYTTDDVLYMWKYGNNVSVELMKDVHLAQFDIIDVTTSNNTETTPFGEFSILKVYIYFERRIGFFILQIYLPCSMITCLSWVSFWINRDAAPARVLLGVTTILATAGIGMTVREGLPRVSYATALDTYLNVCIVYEMAAMIEYAAVNYFTKVLPLEGGADSDDEAEAGPQAGTPPDTKEQGVLHRTESHDNGSTEKPTISTQSAKTSFKLRTVDSCRKNRRRRRTRFGTMLLYCLTGDLKFRSALRGKGNAQAGNAVSDIDVWCRYVFPGTFLFFNISYWIAYLFIF